MGLARRILRLAIPWLILAIGVDAQPPLRLKIRSGERDAGRSRGEQALKRRNLGRRHWIVQFPAWPGPDQLAALSDRSIKILAYVPDFGFSVSADDNTNFEGLGLHWTGAPPGDGKISEMVNLAPGDEGPQFVVIEFHADVDMNDARAIVLDLELQIQESPDLLDHHLLASGTPSQIMRLGEWDEVSYVFPASDELIQGFPVHACAGALTDQGSIGQSVLKVGEGWDGPGRNGADLNYSFINKTPKLQPELVAAEVARAFAEWAKHARLTFTQTADPAANRTIAILFGSRSHGDAYPFDGPGGILAHTFYPYPVNAEPIAGDMHFDADENWQMGADVDLFSVALHEAGHSLGLGHSDKPGAVMYPYYRQSSALTDEDIAAILTMYAAQDGSPATANPLRLEVDEADLTTAQASITLHGSVSGGSGAVTVSWTSSRGFSGTGAGTPKWSAGPIALGIGINNITVLAKDAQQIQVVHTLTIVRQETTSGQPALPQLNINSPVPGGSFNTSTPSVTVAGTAWDASGIVRVTWSNSRGNSGQASGTTSWSTGPIMLQTGTSTIIVKALTQGGASVSQTLQVTYSQPSVGNSTAPPSLIILSPAVTSVSTSASSLAVNGTALDNAGISAVTWTNSTGGSGTAIGTTNWSVGAIPLLVGTNTITVRAANMAGITSWRSLVVSRR